jgi:hypothetical protein
VKSSTFLALSPTGRATDLRTSRVRIDLTDDRWGEIEARRSGRRRLEIAVAIRGDFQREVGPRRSVEMLLRPRAGGLVDLRFEPGRDAKWQPARIWAAPPRRIERPVASDRLRMPIDSNFGVEIEVAAKKRRHTVITIRTHGERSRKALSTTPAVWMTILVNASNLMTFRFELGTAFIPPQSPAESEQLARATRSDRVRRMLQRSMNAVLRWREDQHRRRPSDVSRPSASPDRPRAAGRSLRARGIRR